MNKNAQLFYDHLSDQDRQQKAPGLVWSEVYELATWFIQDSNTEGETT